MFQAPMIAVLTACLCMQLSSSQFSGVSVSTYPVDSFTSAFNTAVQSSNLLPEIFDLSALSPNAFSRSLHDYVYAVGTELGHGNPFHVANTLSLPLTQGINSITLPLMIDINSNAIGKYLYSKGVLNSSNAASLAQQYVKTVEDVANRSFVKGTPESKFLVLQDGFRQYMTSLNQHNVNTLEDLAKFYAREIKRVGTRS